MVLMVVRFGSNDVDKSRAFYDATFDVLGVDPSAMPDGSARLLYTLPGGVRFMCGPTLDGESATPANGGTVGFQAVSEDMVKRWHAAGLANGGTSAGEPEPKPLAGGAFGAYLRDPDGNKITAYHVVDQG